MTGTPIKAGESQMIISMTEPLASQQEVVALRERVEALESALVIMSEVVDELSSQLQAVRSSA